MRKSPIADIIPMGFAIAGVVCLVHLWMSADAAPQLELRVPIAANVPDDSASQVDVLAQA